MIVLDNSVCIAALFDDEREPTALTLLHALLAGDEEAMAPPLFPYEACNAVTTAFRRGRIDERTAENYLEILFGLPLILERDQPMPAVARLARKHGLTVYDAAYLEICKRESLPLATLDRALAQAAKKERIPLVYENS